MINLFPPVLRLTLKALAYEIRQSIVSYIILKGMAKPKDLREALNIKSNDLAYHLRELVKGNIIRRKVRENNEVVYTLTPLGQRLIYNIFMSIAPPIIVRREKKSEEGVDEYFSTIQKVYEESPFLTPSYEPEQYMYPLIGE